MVRNKSRLKSIQHLSRIFSKGVRNSSQSPTSVSFEIIRKSYNIPSKTLDLSLDNVKVRNQKTIDSTYDDRNPYLETINFKQPKKQSSTQTIQLS